MNSTKGKVVFNRIAKDELDITRIFRLGFFLEDVVDYEEYNPLAFPDFSGPLLYVTTRHGNFVLAVDFLSFDRLMDNYLANKPKTIFSIN